MAGLKRALQADRSVLQIAVMHSPEWASDFLVQAIIPATRIVTTVLLTYWLWQEQRVCSTVVLPCDTLIYRLAQTILTVLSPLKA